MLSPSLPCPPSIVFAKRGHFQTQRRRMSPALTVPRWKAKCQATHAEQNQPGPMPEGPAGHLLFIFLDAFHHSPTEVVQKSPYFHAPSISSHGNVDLSSSLTHFREATSVETQHWPSLCKVCKDNTDGHSNAGAGDNVAVTNGRSTSAN